MWNIRKCGITLLYVCKGCNIEGQIVFALYLSDITSKVLQCPRVCNSWLTNSMSLFMCSYVDDVFQYCEQFIKSTFFFNVMLCSLVKWVPTFIILEKPPVSIVIEEAGYNGGSSFVQNVCIRQPNYVVWCEHLKSHTLLSSQFILFYFAFSTWVMFVAEKGVMVWRCESVGFFRSLPAGDVSFSGDGSLLAVTFGPTLTVWVPETNLLKRSLTEVHSKENLRYVVKLLFTSVMSEVTCYVWLTIFCCWHITWLFNDTVSAAEFTAYQTGHVRCWLFWLYLGQGMSGWTQILFHLPA